MTAKTHHIEHSKEDLIFFSLALMIVITIKWNVLFLPLYWDELVVYAGPAMNIKDYGFEYLNKIGWAPFNHPPGLQLLSLPFLWLIKNDVLAIRFYSLVMFTFSLLFIFKIGKYFFDRNFGIIASLLFFSLPEINTHSVMFTGDLTVLPLILAYVYYVLEKKFLPAILLGFLMGMSRETSLAFSILPLFHFYKLRKKEFLLVAFSPWSALLIFLVIQYYLRGSIFNHQVYERGDFGFGFSYLFSGIIRNLKILFYDFGKVWLSLLFLFSYVPLCIRLKKPVFPGEKKFETIILLVLFAIFIIFFSMNRGTIHRYFFLLYPFLIILAITPAYCLNRTFFLALVVIVIPGFLKTYESDGIHRLGLGYEYTLQYREVVKTYQMAANYIDEVMTEDKKLCAFWPLAEALEDPRFGYVEKAHKVSKGDHRNCDLLVWSNSTDPIYLRIIEKVRNEGNYSLLKKFSYNGKYTEIFGKQ